MTTPEVWKSVPGYEGEYEVSSLGQVKSLDRIDRGGKRFRKGTLLKPWVDDKGRPTVLLAGKNKRVCVLVLITFAGARPAGKVACHGDGNPSNNALSNLRWGTHSENAMDAVAHGTHPETRKTHCPAGHALEEGNLVMWQLKNMGTRACLTCQREKSRDSYRRNRAIKAPVAV